MKERPILVATLGIIIGILMGLYFKFSIVLFYIPMIAIYYIISELLLKSKKQFKLISFKRYFRYLKIIVTKKVLILIIITSIISNFIVLIQNKRYENLYKDKEILNITAVVESNCQEDEYENTYIIKIKEPKKYKGTKLYLKVNKKLNKKVEYADKINIKGEFVTPNVATNYEGFNYKNYLKGLKIYGIIKAQNIEIVDKNQKLLIFRLSNNISIKIKENIDKILSEEQSSIVKGIILGDTTQIEEEIQENFKTSNISHILAISGMHVTYIVLGINLLLRKRTSKKLVKYITVITLIFYMFLVGFSPSIVRSSIMIIILIFADIFYRKNDTLNAISISLLFLLIYNPFLIQNIGLQLSYLGTIGIILFHKISIDILKKFKFRKIKYKKTKKTNRLKEILSVTISAQIAILPFILYHFNILSTYFIITNLLVSILIGPLIIYSIFIIFLSFISIQISQIFSIILKIGIKILVLISKISEWDFSKIYIPTPNIYLIIMYYIIVFFLYSIYYLYNYISINNTTCRRFRNLIALFKYKIILNKKKVLKVITFFILSIFIISIIPKDLKIYFVDVGQGDCTFIVTPKNQTILIDGGGSLYKEFNIGKNILIPYILDRGYNKIDYVFISHFDQDHVRRNIIFITRNKS